MARPTRRNRRFQVEWPAWRFGPDGQKAMFEKPEDVPMGWTSRPQLQFERPEPKETPTKEWVTEQLTNLGIEIDPRWGLGKLIQTYKEVSGDN